MERVQQDESTVKECRGCGHCCLTATCTVGLWAQSDAGISWRERRCPFLVWKQERYWCKLALESPVMADKILAGEGCCQPLNDWRRDVKPRG